MSFSFRHLLVLWPSFWVNIEKGFNWLSYLHSPPATCKSFHGSVSNLPCRTHFAKNEKQLENLFDRTEISFYYFLSTLVFFNCLSFQWKFLTNSNFVAFCPMWGSPPLDHSLDERCEVNWEETLHTWAKTTEWQGCQYNDWFVFWSQNVCIFILCT